MRRLQTFRFLVVSLLLLLAAQGAYAEKFKGYIWDLGEGTLVVEGVPVRPVEGFKLERSNHKGIQFEDLQIGWEVEVEGDRGNQAFLAKKIKVKNKRFEKTDLKGFLEVESVDDIELGGRRIFWPADKAPRVTLRSGMQIDGEGVILDDGSIQVQKAELSAPGYSSDEKQFMNLVSGEVAKLKEQLKPVDDPELQDYVARVGERLVPDWIDTSMLQFNYTVIDDPSLNAFALPDGTVVVHTGLLKVLENEAQLATVMGHEIAHATHRHGYRGYKQQTKMTWVSLGALVGGIIVDAKTDSPWAGLLAGIGSGLTINAIVNGHGRDLEDEADRVGLQYMIDAGYDPFEATEVWHIFNAHTGDQNSAANFFFSDHSTHRARISNLTREINSKYRGQLDPNGLKKNEDAYQKATARVKAQPDEPKK